MSSQCDHGGRIRQIAGLLLANRNGTEEWGEISHLDGNPCSKRIANKFLVCCLLDYQMDSNVAWRNGCRLVDDILGDPDDVWRAITSVPEPEWLSRWSEYKLHRFPAGHNRLWRIGKLIRDKYDGDARRIWETEESPQVVERLLAIGAGEQISRMIVGALRDCGQVQGSSDVKADVYVCRVLGRAVIGKPTDAETAARLARQLHPADPWQLDWPLWNVGKSWCDAHHPICSRCYLAPHCAYTTRMPAAAVPSDRLRSTAATGSQTPVIEVAMVSYEEAKAKFANALSVTTYNSANPRFLYFEFTKGKYEKVPFAAYAVWIEKTPKAATYPEWRLKDMDTLTTQ
jgi:endonuclease III